jgi:hypothetical protein
MIVREKYALDPNTDFIKIVVDLDRNIIALGCELHIDCADELVENGSDRKNLWGANLYPQEKEIEYTSMINIRHDVGNRSIEIKNETTKNQVQSIIKKLLF